MTHTSDDRNATMNLMAKNFRKSALFEEFDRVERSFSTNELTIQLGFPLRIEDRIAHYLPSTRILDFYKEPDAESIRLRKDIFEEGSKGNTYVLVYSYHENKLVIVPSWHPLNRTTILPSHAGDYGSGVFEGSSVEPEVSGRRIVGAHLVLHPLRMKRFEISLKSRFFSLPCLPETFDLAIRDLVAVLGEGILTNSKREISRAYLRPSARPGPGGVGVSLKEHHQIDVAAMALHWPYYFNHPKRVYGGSGLRIAFFPDQRLFPILGKNASNYGDAGRVGKLARNIKGIDEAGYFGPYTVDKNGGIASYVNFQEPGVFDAQYENVVIADGPGEGVLAYDGETLYYPPLEVNQLPSSTMWFIVRHLAQRMNIRVEEKSFSLRSVNKNSLALAYVGNAARLAPIGSITVVRENGSLVGKYTLDARRFAPLIKRFESEMSGRTEASYPFLLTAVDLDGGKIAREKLDIIYKGWL